MFSALDSELHSLPSLSDAHRSSDSSSDDVPQEGRTSSKLMLILPLLDKGYRLYVDNFYTSLPLFRMLYQHDIVACGIIQSNQKGYPAKSLAQRKHTLGQSSALQPGEFLAVRFTDKKDVNMLTTMHSATCTTVLLCAVEQYRHWTSQIVFSITIERWVGWISQISYFSHMMPPESVWRGTRSWSSTCSSSHC